MILGAPETWPDARYDILAADPAWGFKTRGKNGHAKSPEKHYRTMTDQEILDLPVGWMAKKNAALQLWTVPHKLPLALKCMAAWGFTYKTELFTWLKLKKSVKYELFLSEKDFDISTGYYTRKCQELCLLGVRGSMKVMDHSVRDIIVAPRREHSRKPELFYTATERLWGNNVKRIELFSRQQRVGWDCWGDQADLFARAAE